MIGRKDFFDLVREFDHSLGIYLTFTVDEKVVHEIADCTSGNAIILHDYQCGISLKDNKAHSVQLIPVFSFPDKGDGYFHPKIALLKGVNEALFIIGSANLTRSAFTDEKEMICSMRIAYDSKLFIPAKLTPIPGILTPL